MIKYVFFDLDGTITDPKSGIVASARYALSKFDITVNDDKELLPFIGPPLIESFKEFYGFDQNKAVRAVKHYRKYYKEKGLFDCFLYEDIEELFIKLKENGYKLAVATCKPEKYAIKLLKYLKMDKYFDFISGATFDETRNSKESVIAQALEKLEITDNNEVIMVGDRKYDVIGANYHNINTIGVLFGYGGLKELEEVKCKYIVSKPLEILEVLKKDSH